MPDSKNLNNLIEYWGNDWKKLHTWVVESFEPGFQKTESFFVTRKHG